VFATYYYIVILFFQSILAESNFEYNNQIRIINQHIYQQEYKGALLLIKKLESKSIFTNNDLVRLNRILSIKVNQTNLQSDYNPRSLGDYVVKSLVFYQNRNFQKSIEFTKVSLQDNIASDSLIKIYEIISEKIPVQSKIKPYSMQVVTSNKLHLNEAMNLLDLMKRKEKTLF